MPRQAAWEVLRSGSPTPLREVDRIASARGLDGRDTGLVRALVGTEIRRRGTLRALVRHFAHRKVTPDLAAHLHLGFVQLLFMDRIPDHAAVSSTVDATRNTLGLNKARFTNALLRAVAAARREGESGDARRDMPLRPWHFEDPVFQDPEEHPLLWAEDALSLPSALYKRWTAQRGAETARALALQALGEPPLSMRVAAGTARDEVHAELMTALEVPDSEAPALRAGVHPQVLLAPASWTEAILESAAFEQGRLQIQGETALRAAEAVEAGAGERVLELCAAPGGKSVVLAQAGAEVLACDLRPARMLRLRENLTRLQLGPRVQPLVCDGTAGLRDAQFDGVLVDAPCSNTGVLAARPSARWRYGPKSKRELQALQARLLREAAACVKPGGRLVWSTCSIDPDENQRAVASLLAEDTSFALEEELESLPGTDTAEASGPGPIDGGYFARLRRS